jgi:hypothetical protein
MFHGPVAMDIEMQLETDDEDKARQKAWSYFYAEYGHGLNPKLRKGSSLVGFEKLEDTDTGESISYGKKTPQLTEGCTDQ